MTLLLLLLIIPLVSYVIYYYYNPNLHHHRHILIAMMSFFYKKITPHSLLNLTTTTTATTTTDNKTLIHHDIPLGLLGLVTNSTSDDFTQRHHPLVLESSSLKKSSNVSSFLPPLPSFLPPPAETKLTSAGSGSSGCGDMGVFGFLDEVDKLDGFVSCTESLGFESSDEIMRVDDRIEPADEEEVEMRLMKKSENKRSEWRRMRDKRSSVFVDKDANNSNKFPPPISSLNKNGHPSFYLRPVRKDGRLEITEVRIHRPEILRAHCEDGRLRLHLISHEDDLDQENNDLDDIDEDGNNIYVEEKVKESSERSVKDGDQWKMGGEGFRRCQDVAESRRHGHHEDIHRVWSQQHCVV